MLAVIDNALLGVTADLPDYYTFEQLLAKLDQVNGAEFARHDAGMKLANVKLKESESFPIYAQRVRRLVSHAYCDYPAHAKEEQALKAFIHGLPNKQGFRTKLKIQEFQTLNAAVRYASLLDQVFREERAAFENMRSMDVAGDIEDYEDVGYASDDFVDYHRKAFEYNGKRASRTKKRDSDRKSRHKQSELKFESDENRRSGDMNGSTCPTCRHNCPKAEAKTPQNSRCYLCSEYGHWADSCKLKDAQNTENKD